MAELKLQNQKWYRRRDGKIVFCIGQVPTDSEHCFLVLTYLGDTYSCTPNGYCRKNEQSDSDLIEYLPDCTWFDWQPPKPEKYKGSLWCDGKLYRQADERDIGKFVHGSNHSLQNAIAYGSGILTKIGRLYTVKGWACKYAFVLDENQPEAKTVYRPFTNAAEFEPYKDKWILKAYNGESIQGQWRIIAFDDVGVFSREAFLTYSEMFEMGYKFSDGTPFGVLVKEKPQT